MTTQRTYRCNLCGDKIETGRGVGVYWVSGGLMLSKPLHETEHHICLTCVHGVLEIAANQPGPLSSTHQTETKA